MMLTVGIGVIPHLIFELGKLASHFDIFSAAARLRGFVMVAHRGWR